MTKINIKMIDEILLFGWRRTIGRAVIGYPFVCLDVPGKHIEVGWHLVRMDGEVAEPT